MANSSKLSLQTKDIIKILELCSGSIIEFRYGDLSIRLNPYLSQNPYKSKENNTASIETAEEPQTPSLISEENTTTQSQDFLDDELEQELLGMENPSAYFKELEEEEVKRAKTHGQPIRK